MAQKESVPVVTLRDWERAKDRALAAGETLAWAVKNGYGLQRIITLAETTSERVAEAAAVYELLMTPREIRRPATVHAVDEDLEPGVTCE